MTQPNFLIIGAAKAGTSSLHEYLGEHPDIFMSHPIKELNYFAYKDPFVHENWPGYEFQITSWNEYLFQFENVKGEKIVGESSPIYLESPVAAQTIFKTLPDVQLLVSLRNPAERAFSGYLMHLRNARAIPLIEEAFSNKNSRYIQGGFYFKKVKRYLDIFGYENIHFVLFDDIKKDTISVVQGIFQFLGVDDSFVPEVEKKYNTGSIPKNYKLNALLMNAFLRQKIAPLFPGSFRQWGKKLIHKNQTDAPELDDVTRKKLSEIYYDDISRLQDLIHTDLSMWMSDR